MTKKRRVARPSHHRSASEPKRQRRETNGNGVESSGSSAEIVCHFQALQRSAGARALADVYEWLGDAVIGELVGRCLLSQFHRSPLSARVFRNLRLAVVTNRNLAQVFDAMGYAAVRRRSTGLDGAFGPVKGDKMKDRADVVEAVVGELVLRLHAQKNKAAEVEGYRAHLDAVLATMLHLHFAERTRAAEERGETVMGAKGPLSVAFNPFACLPEEQLDEKGELVVREGVFEHQVFDEDDKERAFSDLIDEYEQGASAKSSTGDAAPHHYFLPTGKIDAATNVDAVLRDEKRDLSVAKHVRLAMLQLDDGHILRTSSEIFDVFKIYGMAVLSERMSLSLVIPHVAMGSHHPAGSNGSAGIVTSARLTRQRQLALSVANLSKCAALLGIVLPFASEEEGGAVLSQEDSQEEAVRRMQEEHGRANTLRAFVGFHSAIATTSTVATRRSNTLVNAICRTLYEAAFPISTDHSSSSLPPPAIPDRSPLVAVMRSVGEARMFMNSKTCDDLHAAGERPASERKKKVQASLLLRRCDFETLDNLFETLAKEQDAQRSLDQPKPTQQIEKRKRTKKKKRSESLGAKAAHMTGNLERFLHRRFLFCLEEIIVLFAQRKTEACRAQIALFEQDLEPCVDQPHFRKCEVSTSTLTLAMRDSFYRLLLHDICQFHAIVSSSKNTRDGTRITQLRLPLHYTWGNIDQRITTEQQAQC